jgi:hypothetical protein
VPYFSWNLEKNDWLKKHRNVSFEEAVLAIEQGRILTILENPSPKHRNQYVFILEMDGYAHIVPYVESVESLFLKTIIPSRKMTKRFLKGGQREKT